MAAAKVVFTLSGGGRIHSPLGETQLESGSVLTIPSHLECRGLPTGQMHTVTIYIRPDYLIDQVKWLPVANPLVHHLCRTLHDSRELEPLKLPPAVVQDLTPTLLGLAHQSETAMNDFAMLAGVAQVFDTVGKLTAFAAGGAIALGAVPRVEVSAAIALLREGLNYPWRIDELARKVALSPSQLTRLFRAQVGVSPAAFLVQLRADRMADLLTTTGLSVGETALLVGWNNLSMASRSFKQRYGVAPSLYARLYHQHRTDTRTMRFQPM